MKHTNACACAFNRMSNLAMVVTFMCALRILHVLVVTWQFLGSLQLLLALRFSSVTQEVGLSNIVDRIAAFADFNADKVTDVLVLNSTGV